MPTAADCAFPLVLARPGPRGCPAHDRPGRRRAGVRTQATPLPGWPRLPGAEPKFRWCTERLKIKPSNAFIHGVVQKYGEAILVLGTRKAESQRRTANIERHAARQVRDRLVPNASLPNSLVYTPIEDWNNDDVWLYLMQVKNPWGHDNKSLLGMYQGATEGGECPLVVDSSTPSCGSSRFGCWVCTVVNKDRSMEAMGAGTGTFHVCSARRLQNAGKSLGELRRDASRRATKLDLSTLAQLLRGSPTTTAQPRTGTAGPGDRCAVPSVVSVVLRILAGHHLGGSLNPGRAGPSIWS